jgi:hypothetical protein
MCQCGHRLRQIAHRARAPPQRLGRPPPVEDYVAMPIGNHELYVAWLDTKTHALLDVFVMNFKTHVVFDYAPGSLHPESSGTIKIMKTGRTRAP